MAVLLCAYGRFFVRRVVDPGLSGMITRKYGFGGGAAILKARRKVGATGRFEVMREAMAGELESVFSVCARDRLWKKRAILDIRMLWFNLTFRCRTCALALWAGRDHEIIISVH